MPFDISRFEPTPTDDLLRVLEYGLEVVSRPGFWVCTVGNGETGCAGSAIQVAAAELGVWKGPNAFHPGWNALSAQVLPLGYSHIGDYNDRPGSTLADIQAIYRSAISARRAELLETQSLGAGHA